MSVQDFASRLSRKGGTVFFYGNILIALLAFCIRFAVSYQLAQSDPAVTNPSVITDMRTYLELADQILKGKFPETFYYQPFYYAVFLPLCRMISTGALFLAFCQSLLGAATVYLTGECGRLLAGKKGGLCSALLCCFAFIHVYFTPYALLEVLQGFWITLLFYLLLRLRKEPSYLRWGIWGFLLGCSILTRGNTLLFLIPAFMALFSLRKKFPRKRVVFCGGILILGMVLPQAPFAIYNTVKTGHLCGPSTAGGAVLAFGNNPEGAPAGLELPYPKTYELWLSKEKECSVPQRMLQWFCREPGAFLEQQFQKVMFFWDSMDYPNNVTEENARKSSLVRSLRFLPSGVILALALAGLLSILYRKRLRCSRRIRLFSAFVVLYFLSIALFYILARFRLPAIGLLCMAGAIFLGELFRKSNSFTIRVRLLLLGGIAVFMVYGFCPLYSVAYEPLMARVFRPCGVQTGFESSPWQWQTAPPQTKKFLMVCDHSSILRGGWSGIGAPFKVQKTFAVPEDLKILPQALLVLPAPGKGGIAVLSVNGIYTAVQVQNGMIKVSVPVQNVGGKVKVDLEVTESRGEWSCVLDTRRDYARTVINGKEVPGEFAAFLVLAVAP
ncbi:MAG: glycosyltransferase family 39 protein [Lentisphaeria bacterium]|nr:glycosyltransferase family 39 protein [Lentisphaeria bacterium]